MVLYIATCELSQRPVWPDSEMDWKSILEECRSHRKNTSQERKEWEAFYARYKLHFIKIGLQLSSYAGSEVLTKPPGDNEKEDTAAAVSSWRSLVIDTRCALRLGLQILSIPVESIQHEGQHHAITCGWDDSLLAILCNEKGDSKCRQLCSQLLCNLTTTNPETSESINSKIQLEPTDFEIHSRLQDAVIDDNREQTAISDVDSLTKMISTINWMDMILMAARSGNREALGAIVASMHNSIVAISSTTVENECSQLLTERIAKSHLLVATLLRQALPSTAIQTLTNLSTYKDNTEQQQSSSDVATEWIAILLKRLFKHGLFPALYVSAGAGDDSLKTVVPERVVLLHCLQGIHAGKEKENSSESTAPTSSVFGSDENTIKALEFLGRAVSTLLVRPLDAIEDSGNRALRRSAYITILLILAEELSFDSDVVSSARSRLVSTILPLCNALANLDQTLMARTEGLRKRDIQISSEEQEELIALVRVIGNVCHKCKPNQDKLRVPIVSTLERNGLHVLLSSTSYATSCFTLREWAVVAIHNVLEDNSDNQQVVAELQAQEAINSPTLGRSGVQVDLAKDGTVNISPKEL